MFPPVLYVSNKRHIKIILAILIEVMSVKSGFKLLEGLFIRLSGALSIFAASALQKFN